MPGKLTPINLNDFSGGLNLTSNPYDLKKNQLYRLTNLVLDEHGSLRTRPGMSLVSLAPTTNPIIYRQTLNLVNGVSYPFAIQTIGGVNQLFNISSNPWASVGSFNTAYITPDSRTFIGKEVFVAGYETPWSWDGTTFAQVTAGGGETLPPGAKHIANHLSEIWLWNTAATTTSLDGPSSLRTSAVNNIGSWPSANQVFISKDDGQVGMGLATYTIAETGISPTATIIAFKNYSTYQILGILSGVSGAFSVEKLKSDLGCIAPRSIQFATGFGIIRLSHKGFALYNGTDDKLISEEVRPAILGNGTDFTSLDFSNIERSWSAQSQNPPLYVCACPVSGAALTRVFVYDLIRQAWTICTYPIAFSCINNVYTPTNVTLQAGAMSTGQVVNLFGLTDTTDLGSAISWSVTPPPAYIGSPTAQSYWRRFLIDLTYTPQQIVNFSTTLAGISGALSDTRTMPLLFTEGRTDVGIQRKCPSILATITGTGNVRIRAFTWQGRQMPLTRAVQ